MTCNGSGFGVALITLYRNLIEIPHSDNKENTGHIEYVLEYKPVEEKENYDNLNDQELMKIYQGLVFKVNKLKDQKTKLNNSEVKNKYIKALHKYNELKVKEKIWIYGIINFFHRILVKL